MKNEKRALAEKQKKTKMGLSSLYSVQPASERSQMALTVPSVNSEIPTLAPSVPCKRVLSHFVKCLKTVLHNSNLSNLNAGVTFCDIIYH